MPRRNSAVARPVHVSTRITRLDAQSNAPIAATSIAKLPAEESPSIPCPKEMSSTLSWRSRLGSARVKHSPKAVTGAGVQKTGSVAGAKTGIIEFWADVWASGGEDDMLPPLPEHKPTETLNVDLGLTDGGAAREVSLADLIKPARSQRKPGKANDFEIVPRVREVIALDDRNEGPEPDDAWEVVLSDGEDDGRAVLSYADIVANKAA